MLFAMAQTNVLKKYLDAGIAFTNMTQTKAEALVKDLVRTGEVQTEQAQAAVADIVERSRKNTEALIEQIRKDISSSAESPSESRHTACHVARRIASRSIQASAARWATAWKVAMARSNWRRSLMYSTVRRTCSALTPSCSAASAAITFICSG